MAGVYEFSRSFQEKILALVWREPATYTIYKECLRPQFFEDEIHIDISRIIFNYYDKYETQPTLEAMLEEVRVLSKSTRLKEDRLKDYVETVKAMVNADLADAAYVRDKIVAFGKKQALTEAIIKSADDIAEGREFEGIEKRIKEANAIGENIGDFGTDYFETIDERMEEYDARDAEKVKTGIEGLDKVMAGGLGKGELGIVIAPPGTGKTLSLINIGKGATNDGKNVAHFSLEMNETRVSQRYDSTFMDKTFDYIKDNRPKIAKALGLVKKHRKGKLKIKSYPTRTCTVDMIKSYLTKIKLAEGFVPDVIIIDYPDLLRPTAVYSERRTELEILYEELRGLGQEFDCAVWGASQTNRGALEKKVVTIADLAESFGKAATADFMIAISQTKQEKKDNELRYYVAKSRNGESDSTIVCDVFYDRMSVKSNAERQAVWELQDHNEDDTSGKRRERFKREVEREQKRAEETVSAGLRNKMGGGED